MEQNFRIHYLSVETTKASVGTYYLDRMEDCEELLSHLTDEPRDGQHHFTYDYPETWIAEVTGFKVYGYDFFKETPVYLSVDMPLEIGTLAENLSEAIVQYERDQEKEHFGAAYLRDALNEAFNTACEQDIDQSLDQIRSINGWELQKIDNQTPEICLEAVKSVGKALQYVNTELRTPEICMAAVENDGFAIQYVENQTPEICLVATRNLITAFEYLKDPAQTFHSLSTKDRAFIVHEMGNMAQGCRKENKQAFIEAVLKDPSPDVRAELIYWAMAHKPCHVLENCGIDVKERLRNDHDPEVRKEVAEWEANQSKPLPKKDKGMDI